MPELIKSDDLDTGIEHESVLELLGAICEADFAKFACLKTATPVKVNIFSHLRGSSWLTASFRGLSKTDIV